LAIEPGASELPWWILEYANDLIQMNMKSKTIQANLIVLITAVIWGGGFVAQHLGLQQRGLDICMAFDS